MTARHRAETALEKLDRIAEEMEELFNDDNAHLDEALRLRGYVREQQPPSFQNGDHGWTAVQQTFGTHPQISRT